MTTQIHLPDVSEYQRNVDWPKVVAHNGGAAIVRVYNGRRADHLWPARRAAAHAAHIKVLGLYAYLVKDRPAITQAQEFVKLVGKLLPGEFVILDIEEGVGDQHARAQAFLHYCDVHLETTTWLYSYASFLTSRNLMSLGLPHRPLWLAAYQLSPPATKHTLWQHTSNEAWPGIGKCDCSIYVGTMTQLLAAVHHAVPVVPAPAKATTPAKTTPAKPVPTEPGTTGVKAAVKAVVTTTAAPKPVHTAQTWHDLLVAVGVFVAAMGASLADSIGTNKAITVAAISAAVSAGVKALARHSIPGAVDVPTK